MSKPQRLNILIDDETYLALRKLAQADDRSMAAQMRWMIRRDAASRGLWSPPRAVPVVRKSSA